MMFFNIKYKHCVREEMNKVRTKVQEYKDRLKEYSNKYGNLLKEGTEVTPEYREYVLTTIEYNKLKGVYRTLRSIYYDFKMMSSRQPYQDKNSIRKTVRELMNDLLHEDTTIEEAVEDNPFKAGDKVRVVDNELNRVEEGVQYADMFHLYIGKIYEVHYVHGSGVAIRTWHNGGMDSYTIFHYSRFELASEEGV